MMQQLPLFGKNGVDFSERLRHLAEPRPCVGVSSDPLYGDPQREGENIGPRGLASSYAQFWSIVTHPAFRIGFLDARRHAPFDHEDIRARVLIETPSGALKRLGINVERWRDGDIENAQIRYEEGRRALIEYGLKCRAWGHPDYPPAAVRDLIVRLTKERQSCSA